MHMMHLLNIEIPFLLKLRTIYVYIVKLKYSGPEGFEPSTNYSAGSHSIQTELWVQIVLILNPYIN